MAIHLASSSEQDVDSMLAQKPGLLRTVILGVLLIAFLFLMFYPGTVREWVGGSALLLMLVLLGFRVPVGISMIVASALGLYAVSGWAIVDNSLRTIPFNTVAGWSLAVVPLFILMGVLLSRSGLTGAIFDASRAWLGRLPGGLGVTTNIAGAGLASVSGSTVGITYALGKLAIPEMLKAGYNPRLATGTVVVAGTLGQLIPPSILLVLYAGIAGTPVGQQLISGIVPGVLIAIGFTVTVVIVASVQKIDNPRMDIAWRDRLRATISIWPILLLFLVVVGGIFTGIFTATEAAAVGAAIALVFTLHRWGARRGLKQVGESLMESGRATAAIMLLFIGAYLITRLLTASGLAFAISDFVGSINLDRVWILLILLLLYLVMGMFVDPLTMMVLTVPLLVPLVEPLGVSPIWFGVFVVIMGELAIITPPVGMLTFVVHKIASRLEVEGADKIQLKDVFIGVGYFIPSIVLIILLLIFFPEIVEFLPNLSSA